PSTPPKEKATNICTYYTVRHFLLKFVITLPLSFFLNSAPLPSAPRTSCAPLSQNHYLFLLLFHLGEERIAIPSYIILVL
ncbi:hypothetical protein Leryth_021004, partial [Lithospermum erythrorhizon]